MSSEIKRRIEILTGLFSLGSRNVKSAMIEWAIFSCVHELSEGRLPKVAII